jgi:hypothetical protein
MIKISPTTEKLSFNQHCVFVRFRGLQNACSRVPRIRPISTASPLHKVADSRQAQASSLTLVDDGEVTQAIESARLLRHMQPQNKPWSWTSWSAQRIGLKRVQPTYD